MSGRRHVHAGQRQSDRKLDGLVTRKRDSQSRRRRGHTRQPHLALVCTKQRVPTSLGRRNPSYQCHRGVVPVFALGRADCPGAVVHSPQSAVRGHAKRLLRPRLRRRRLQPAGASANRAPRHHVHAARVVLCGRARFASRICQRVTLKRCRESYTTTEGTTHSVCSSSIPGACEANPVVGTALESLTC